MKTVIPNVSLHLPQIMCLLQRMLLKLCDKVIARGPISNIRIYDELNKAFAGRKLMKKFSAF